MRKLIFGFIIILIILHNSFCSKSYNLLKSNPKRVYTGLENFLDDYADDYENKRAAVVTNHSGVDFYLQNNIKLFRENNIEIALILAPEHGLYGYQNDYSDENYIVDDRLNAVVYNIHKLNSKELRHLLKVADFIIFDMQDMGMRCYTYVSVLKFLMDTLSGTNMKLVVLDRPNPLGFLYASGPFLEKKFYSKNISSFPVPLFYNMTIGEAALYYNGEYTKNVNLHVIPMEGYYRRMLFNNTMLPWVPPSPNLPTYISSIIYSVVVLMEGINISVGRGTTKPFEYIGAPWIEPVAFSKGLNELNLKNFAFRPVYFEPTFSKYEKERCGGVQIFYTGGSFNPVEVSFKLIQYIMHNYSQFRWDSYKNSYDIDRLAGTDKFRKFISEKKNYQDFFKDIESGIYSFLEKRKKYLIYPEDYLPL